MLGSKIVFAVLMIAVVLPIQPGLTQQSHSGRSWQAEKCFRYKRDFSEVLRRWGLTGVSREFIEGNDAFIAAGCDGGEKVCPRSARDRELIEVLTIRVVNEGMSSTFLPFAYGTCAKAPAE
jgi:hypothetical protein